MYKIMTPCVEEKSDGVLAHIYNIIITNNRYRYHTLCSVLTKLFYGVYNNNSHNDENNIL